MGNNTSTKYSARFCRKYSPLVRLHAGCPIVCPNCEFHTPWSLCRSMRRNNSASKSRGEDCSKSDSLMPPGPKVATSCKLTFHFSLRPLYHANCCFESSRPQTVLGLYSRQDGRFVPDFSNTERTNMISELEVYVPTEHKADHLFMSSNAGSITLQTADGITHVASVFHPHGHAFATCATYSTSAAPGA